MTSNDAITIKKMVEGIWNLPQTPESDIVWVNTLEEELFIIVYKAVLYLAKYNGVYPPKLPQIVQMANSDDLYISSDLIKNNRLRAYLDSGQVGEIDSVQYRARLLKFLEYESKGIYPEHLKVALREWLPELNQQERVRIA